MQMTPILRSIADTIRSSMWERFWPQKLDSIEKIAGFVAARAAYVAQTSLYGYLKTRMGTQFRSFFEDDVFSKVIHDAAIQLFASCAADLSVYTAGLVVDRTGCTDEAARLIARRLFRDALGQGVAADDRDRLPETALADFDARVERTHWPGAAQGEREFQTSVEDLLRLAPVIDEFKLLDAEIVRNSIRFRWLDIREQARKRLDAEALEIAFR